MSLMDYLPAQAYHDEPHVQVFQDAVEVQVKKIQAARDDIKAQARPSTATSWGMAMYERAYGITPDASKPLDQRLAAWRARRRGTGTTTAGTVKNIAVGFYNGDVDVVEHKKEFWFEVVFKSLTGIPPNLDDLKAAIEEVKPAHMEAVYVILYITHSELGKFTHAQLSAYTHGQLHDGPVG